MATQCTNPTVLGYLEIQLLKRANYAEMMALQKKEEERIQKESSVPAEQVFQ